MTEPSDDHDYEDIDVLTGLTLSERHKAVNRECGCYAVAFCAMVAAILALLAACKLV